MEHTTVELKNGATITLVNDEFICRTKTGKKLHRSHPGSSVAYGYANGCGHWFKASASYFKVSPTAVTPEHVMCEICFPVINHAEAN